MIAAAKNVLVTGGSRGIGQAIVNKLKETGLYEVYCPTREELNLKDEASVENYLKKNNRFDILINNAGINILSSIENISSDKIDAMLATNLIAPLKLIQGVVPFMKQNQWGRIVNISSIWGINSKEDRSLYSITKFGINGLTKALAKELGPYNILVNSICPGYVNTELTRTNVSPESRIKIQEAIPLRRFAEPEEIANFVSFLVSEANTYITSQLLAIDGGFL